MVNSPMQVAATSRGDPNSPWIPMLGRPVRSRAAARPRTRPPAPRDGGRLGGGPGVGGPRCRRAAWPSRLRSAGARQPRLGGYVLDGQPKPALEDCREVALEPARHPRREGREHDPVVAGMGLELVPDRLQGRVAADPGLGHRHPGAGQGGHGLASPPPGQLPGLSLLPVVEQVPGRGGRDQQGEAGLGVALQQRLDPFQQLRAPGRLVGDDEVPSHALSLRWAVDVVVRPPRSRCQDRVMTSFRVDSEIGRLRKVLLHSPDLELTRLTPANMHDMLFDEIMWAGRARIEHQAFADVLRSRGVEVFELADLLATALADDGGRKELLDRVVTVDGFGAGLAPELRAWFDSLDAAQLVTYLIGGGIPADLPFRPQGVG